MKQKIHRIIVLIPFRNAKRYILDCINSVLNQIYPLYEIYLLDDQSTDGTSDLISGEININKIFNKNRLGPMGNIYNALRKIKLLDDDIVILLDGDDYLLVEYTFQLVNDRYNDNVLLTYGQYINNFGLPGHCSEYSKSEYLNLRKSPWKASHLKTFKYKLFKALLEQDPNGSYCKFEDGSFFTASSDMGIMIPLIEVAGYGNISFIPNLLYCYRIHQNNDHASDLGKQSELKVEHFIRNKISFLKTVF